MLMSCVFKTQLVFDSKTQIILQFENKVAELSTTQPQLVKTNLFDGRNQTYSIKFD